MTRKIKIDFRVRKLNWVAGLILIVGLIPIFPILGQGSVVKAEANWPWPIMIAKSPNDPRFSEQINLNQIKIPSAWDVTTGSSDLIVAVIDTGINPSHEELSGRLWVNIDEVPNNGRDDDNNGFIDDHLGYNFMNNTGDIIDQNGHGTGVASIIGANTANARGMAGINWNSKLMILKALNSAGGGEYNNVATALKYATDNGAKVINMSFGTYFDSTDLRGAIDYAIAKNVVVVAAAGNNNQNQLLYPAAYSNVISVGAVDKLEQRASFSNYGNNLDVVAPGINVLMADYAGENAYSYGSGTSFAAAHVTGIASLILSRNNTLSPLQVENIIKNTTSGSSNQLEYGKGLVNAASALGSSQINDRIIGKITASSAHAVADNQTQIHITVTVVNNDFPLANHQIRAYINGPLTLHNEVIDRQEIYFGTTDMYGMVGADVSSNTTGNKLIIFSDATAGINLGDLTIAFDPVGGPPKYSAVKVSQSDMSVLKPGEKTTLSVDLRNTGNISWQGNGSIVTGQMRLGTAHPQDRNSKLYTNSWLSNNRVATLQQSIVNPGETGRFSFAVQAPMQPGTYTEYFNPVIEYTTWLSDMRIFWEIAVTDNGVDPVSSHYNAEIIYKSSNLTMSPGQTEMLQVEMKNTGTAKWVNLRQSSYGAVKLGTVSPYDRNSLLENNWLGPNRAIDTGFIINPGDRLTLSFPIKAPLQPGVYLENFRLVSEYITWFGPAMGWKITVR